MVARAPFNSATRREPIHGGSAPASLLATVAELKGAPAPVS